MNPTAQSLGLLGQTLNAASLRHRVIAQNVANVNTPGYRRLEVKFAENLASALSSQNGSASPAMVPRVEIADGPERVDGNTVDIDVEMNQLVKNALLYQAAASVAASRIATMRSAITGR